MVSADTIQTVKIKDPDTGLEYSVEMTIKDYIFYKMLKQIGDKL